VNNLPKLILFLLAVTSLALNSLHGYVPRYDRGYTGDDYKDRVAFLEAFDTPATK
jgi:hypothetical protein